MPRKYKRVTSSKTDIIKLHELSIDSDNPRLALRAQIVLRCIEGEQVKDIAAALGERPNTVILWRRRYESDGIQGLRNLPRGDSGGKYGDDLKKRILDKLNTEPPDGSSRWTGRTLSEELGIPPDVVWRYLRKEGVKLSDVKVASEDISVYEEEIYDLPLELHVRKDTAMSKDNSVSHADETVGESKELMDLIVTARIVGKDGTVIEKEIHLEDCLPDVADFDLSTKEGFLRDFDKLEKSMLSARGQLTEGITKEYLDNASKKNSSQKKP